MYYNRYIGMSERVSYIAQQLDQLKRKPQPWSQDDMRTFHCLDDELKTSLRKINVYACIMGLEQ